MCEKNELQAFLKQKAASTTPTPNEVDWKARKDKWLSQIAQLYKMIREWIAPLEKDKTVRFQMSHISLEEDYIGPYQVDVLALSIGKQCVEFHPKGTLIVGVDGRVDVRGLRGVRTLVLKGDQWLILERSPHLKTLPFNEDSFQDVLQEVME